MFPQKNLKPAKAVLGPLVFLLGCGAATMLTMAHLAGRSPACGEWAGCAATYNDAWSKVGPVPVSLLALGWFWLLALVPKGEGKFDVGRALGLLGVAAALAYSGRSAFVLHAFCPYCLTMAFAALTIGGARWLGSGPVPTTPLLAAGIVGVGVAFAARGTVLAPRALFSVAAANRVGWTALDRPETRLGTGVAKEVWFVSPTCPSCREHLAAYLELGGPTISLRFQPFADDRDRALAAMAIAAGRNGKLRGFIEALLINAGSERLKTFAQVAPATSAEVDLALGEDDRLASELKVKGVPARMAHKGDEVVSAPF